MGDPSAGSESSCSVAGTEQGFFLSFSRVTIIQIQIHLLKKNFNSRKWYRLDPHQGRQSLL